MTGRRRPCSSTPTRRRCRWVALGLVAFLLGVQTVLGTPAAAAGPFDDCTDPPPVEVIGAGMVGSLDPPQGNGPKDSLYLNYSYAGFVWHTYDTPRSWPCVDPFATITTWVGSRLFDGGKLIVGAVNGLHYELRGPTGLLASLDELVRKGSTVLYSGAAVPYLGFALILVAVAIFLHTLNGNLANTAKAVTRVLLGLTVMSATYLSPLLYTRLLDGLLVSGVTELETNLFAQVAPDAIVRDILPDLLHRHIVVENWIVGEFGTADTPFAQQAARRLVDAQACSWAEVREGTCPDRVTHKQEEFTKIAEQVRGGAASYPTFQGINSGRIGAGLLALAEGLCFGLFQLVCKVGILLGQLVLRGTVLIGPVLGLLCFVPGVARTVFRTIAGVVVQAVILSAAATTHTIVMLWILDSQLASGRMARLLLMGIITVLAWVLIKPGRRLRNMAAGAVGIPAISHNQWRLERLLRRRYRHHRSRRGWRHPTPSSGRAEPQSGAQETLLWRSATTGWSYTESGPARPETAPATPVIRATSQRVHTPDPYHRAQLDPAPPDPPQRKPPRTGPPPRPPGTGTTRRRHGARRPDGPGTESDGLGSGGGNGTRAEARPAPHSRDAVIHLPASPAAGAGGDVVVPSDLEQRDQRTQRSESQSDPTVTEPDTSNGPTVYRIYRPSTNRVEADPPADDTPADDAPPQRPEAADPSGWRATPPWEIDP